MGDGLYFATSSGRLVAGGTKGGYVLPLFPRLADVEEFLVGTGITGKGEPVLCPDMLADLCRFCVPKPGIKWIVMGPPPELDFDCDRHELVSTERFLEAFRKIYADELEG